MTGTCCIGVVRALKTRVHPPGLVSVRNTSVVLLPSSTRLTELPLPPLSLGLAVTVREGRCHLGSAPIEKCLTVEGCELDPGLGGLGPCGVG